MDLITEGLKKYINLSRFLTGHIHLNQKSADSGELIPHLGLIVTYSKDNGGDRTERSQLFSVRLFSYTAFAVVTDRIAKNPAGLE